MSGGTVTVQCWGCNKSETHPLVHGAENNAQKQEMASRGWMRRAFYPSTWDKGPWFCSKECAYESYNAKVAEELNAKFECRPLADVIIEQTENHQQEDFHKYCKETPMPSWFVPLMLFITAFWVSFILTRIFL